jgi:ectoine hydroxylase-related dioxygenase (phytanoyl-CoA dioxygenase family)
MLNSPLVTQEDVDAFYRDGAICLRHIVSSAMIDRMRAACDRIIAEEKLKSRDDSPHFLTKLYLWRTDEEFRSFAMDSGLVAIAADVMKTKKVNLFADQLLVKEPGSTDPTPWHQDLPYWPLGGFQLCTIWMPLDPVSLTSGAVQYIKGSHRWGKWYKPRSFVGEGYEEHPGTPIPDFDKEREQHEFLHWDTEPGDCIIHHPLVVHGATGNMHSSLSRRAIAPRYAGDDVVYKPLPGRPRSEVTLQAGDPIDSSMFPVLWPRADIDAPVRAN